MRALTNAIESNTVSAQSGKHVKTHIRTAFLAPFLLAMLALGGGGFLSGCTIPSDCGDLDYPTYGGAWQRTRRDSGRVGSLFDPAGARAPALTARDETDDVMDARSPAESIHSTPPGRPAAEPRDRRPLDPDDLPEPSPSDQLDRDRLRALDLEEIDIEAGSPAPPELN